MKIYLSLLVTVSLFVFGCSSNSSDTSESPSNVIKPVLADTTLSVAENSLAATNVGTVTIVNEGDSVITLFTLTGTGSSLFDINASGSITVAQSDTLDYETVTSYTLSLTATNSAGVSDSVVVMIKIDDIADTPGAQDNDGDGYTAESDCNDRDFDINPGAIEICDNIDNDCDSQVDEDAVDQQIFYLDSDKDGYGDSSTTVLACIQPQGYIDNGIDCNDSAPQINPDITEACDDIDNNCDGRVDEVCLIPSCDNMDVGSFLSALLSSKSSEYMGSAGIKDVLDGLETQDINITDVNINITSAIVIAINYKGFWIGGFEDGRQVAIYIHEGLRGTPEVAVGDKVSFTVKQVIYYYGNQIQITDRGPIAVQSVGHSIYVQAMGSDISYDKYSAQLFWASGIVQNISSCDGAICCDLEYTQGIFVPVRILDSSVVLNNGDCLQLVAPLSLVYDETGFNIVHSLDWININSN